MFSLLSSVLKMEAYSIGTNKKQYQGIYSYKILSKPSATAKIMGTASASIYPAASLSLPSQGCRTTQQGKGEEGRVREAAKCLEKHRKTAVTGTRKFPNIG
jgi:hypothetical protein